MSSVEDAIREEIQQHEREIERLRRMLAAGSVSGAASIRDIIIEQLTGGPKTVAEILQASQCKPNSLYVQLARMKRASEIARDADGKYQLI
jgi:predicted transcriptional regulator